MGLCCSTRSNKRSNKSINKNFDSNTLEKPLHLSIEEEGKAIIYAKIVKHDKENKNNYDNDKLETIVRYSNELDNSNKESVESNDYIHDDKFLLDDTITTGYIPPLQLTIKNIVSSNKYIKFRNLSSYDVLIFVMEDEKLNFLDTLNKIHTNINSIDKLQIFRLSSINIAEIKRNFKYYVTLKDSEKISINLSHTCKYSYMTIVVNNKGNFNVVLLNVLMLPYSKYNLTNFHAEALSLFELPNNILNDIYVRLQDSVDNK